MKHFLDLLAWKPKSLRTFDMWTLQILQSDRASCQVLAAPPAPCLHSVAWICPPRKSSKDLNAGHQLCWMSQAGKLFRYKHPGSKQGKETKQETFAKGSNQDLARAAFFTFLMNMSAEIRGTPEKTTGKYSHYFAFHTNQFTTKHV